LDWRTYNNNILFLGNIAHDVKCLKIGVSRSGGWFNCFVELRVRSLCCRVDLRHGNAKSLGQRGVRSKCPKSALKLPFFHYTTTLIEAETQGYEEGEHK